MDVVPAAHTLVLDDHRLVVVRDGDTLVLTVAGTEVVAPVRRGLTRVVPPEGTAPEGAAVFALTPGDRLVGCVLRTPAVRDGEHRRRASSLPFEPPEDSRLHRAWRFQRDHPVLLASRHVVVAAVQVIVALLGLRLVLNLVDLPDLDLPDLPDLDLPDLPDLPWPDWSLPDLLPDWTLPGWLAAVLESRHYWLPLLVALAVTSGEVRRRRARSAAGGAPRSGGVHADDADRPAVDPLRPLDDVGPDGPAGGRGGHGPEHPRGDPP